MNHKELVEKFSSNIFKESGKIENSNSWSAMRNYLEQLDDFQLKAMLKEKKFFINKPKIVIVDFLSFGNDVMGVGFNQQCNP